MCKWLPRTRTMRHICNSYETRYSNVVGQTRLCSKCSILILKAMQLCQLEIENSHDLKIKKLNE